MCLLEVTMNGRLNHGGQGQISDSTVSNVQLKAHFLNLAKLFQVK
jgi:hypothetical protein